MLMPEVKHMVGYFAKVALILQIVIHALNFMCVSSQIGFSAVFKCVNSSTWANVSRTRGFDHKTLWPGNYFFICLYES